MIPKYILPLSGITERELGLKLAGIKTIDSIFRKYNNYFSNILKIYTVDFSIIIKLFFIFS